MFGLFVLAIVLVISRYASSATDKDSCADFAGEAAHEIAVMKQISKEITAAANPDPGVPRIGLETLYGLKLAAQSGVTFVANPERTDVEAGSYAGLVKFRVPKARRYRVSISSTHWIDIIDGSRFLEARAFQGHRGCKRPRKIVEYELPEEHDLILQLSGFSESSVLVAITAV